MKTEGPKNILSLCYLIHNKIIGFDPKATVDGVATIPSIMYTVSSPMVVDFWLLEVLRIFKLLELILFDEMHGCCKCLCLEQYMSRLPGLTVQPSKFISNFDPENKGTCCDGTFCGRKILYTRLEC